MLEQLIQDAFDDMAGLEQPPAQVSIRQAIQQARSRLRRRWLSTVGTPVLAAGAVLAIVVTGAIPSSQLGSPPRRPAIARTPKPVLAPRQFNPLVPYAAFGWLPAGESAGGGRTSRTEDVQNAGRGYPSWQLSVYARGQCSRNGTVLRCSTGLTVRAEPTAAVSGHSAYWSGTYLAWQYARDGWVTLQGPLSDRTPTPAYGRVARHVTFGASTRPVEFAVQLTRVPATWSIGSAEYQQRAGVLLAEEFSLTNGNVGLPPGPSADQTNLPFFAAAPAGGANGCSLSPGGQMEHRLLDGNQTLVTVVPGGSGRPPSHQVCAFDANGLWIFVSVNGWHPAISPVTLFGHLRILGTSPSAWTTQPIAP